MVFLATLNAVQMWLKDKQTIHGLLFSYVPENSERIRVKWPELYDLNLNTNKPTK